MLVVDAELGVLDDLLVLLLPPQPAIADPNTSSDATIEAARVIGTHRLRLAATRQGGAQLAQASTRNKRSIGDGGSRSWGIRFPFFFSLQKIRCSASAQYSDSVIAMSDAEFARESLLPKLLVLTPHASHACIIRKGLADEHRHMVSADTAIRPTVHPYHLKTPGCDS